MRIAALMVAKRHMRIVHMDIGNEHPVGRGLETERGAASSTIVHSHLCIQVLQDRPNSQ